MLKRRTRKGRARQAGLSIVELMVGVAIGLIVVAAASLLMTTQLHENRRLLTETQLQQDLRAATDIMTRELRRSGTREDIFALKTIWYPGVTNTTYNNFPEKLNATSSGQVEFWYEPGLFVPVRYGYKLENDIIKTYLGGWQELTDGNVMRVLTFTPTVTLANATPIRIPCANLCPDGTTACWPSYQVRDVEIAITAVARSDPSVTRSIRSKVRLRSDYIRYDASGQVCPA